MVKRRFESTTEYSAPPMPSPVDAARRPILSLEPDRIQAAWLSQATGFAIALFVGMTALAKHMPWYAVLIWTFGSGLGAASIVFLVLSWVFVWLRLRRWASDRDAYVPTVIREADTVRVEMHDATTGQLVYADLPLARSKLIRLAIAVLENHKTFSRPALKGVLTQGEYNRLAPVMERRGLVTKLPGNRRELTDRGRRVLRGILDE